MQRQKLVVAVTFCAAITTMGMGVASVASGASVTSRAKVIRVPDQSLKPTTTVVGGASVLRTTSTLQHWHSTAKNPVNGVTYGYNMVGANPFTCTGSKCSATIEADITPIVVHIDGRTYSGNDVLGPTLASPVFTPNDYGTTTAATAQGSFPNPPALVQGPGGPLSQGDAGNLLQLEDATMRAQFNQTGTSGYHLLLSPKVLPAVTINVPQDQGVLLVSGRGVVFADIKYKWWTSAIAPILNKQSVTHLPILLTNNVMLYEGKNVLNCCVIGFHGATTRATGSNGLAAKVQTFAWASWIQPGLFARSSGGTDWAVQDIHALSHEISEWADDPFVGNTVQPWKTPTAPQYGCSGLLETGDPVVGIGFALGTNTFQQGPNPNGSASSADGFFHPEDEVFLPWFMRTAPNTISEPTQLPSTNVGRYTLMGSLNPFGGFQSPATGC
jgi:hypothetical protein